MVVGLDVRQCLLDGGVAPGRGEGVLQPAALRAVVVDVIGGRHRDTRAVGQRCQLPVAGGVAFEKILLQFHVHRIVTEPLPVGVEQPAGVLAPAFREQPGQRPVAASGEQYHPAGVFRQVSWVQPGFPLAGGVGQGEQAGDVGVALTVPGQEHDAGAVREGQFSAGDGPNAQAAGQAGELQGAAEVGVGQGQGRIPVLPGPGQQFVDVGGPHSKGIEALDVEFHVTGRHG